MPKDTRPTTTMEVDPPPPKVRTKPAQSVPTKKTPKAPAVGTPSAIIVLVIFMVTVIPLLASGLLDSGQIQKPAIQNAASVAAEEAQPISPSNQPQETNPEQKATVAYPNPNILPTLNPNLLAGISGGSDLFLIRPAEAQSFEVILETAYPLLSGIQPGETGIAVMDAINRLKFALVNSSSDEEMRNTMQNEGGLIKQLAQKDPVAEGLRAGTFHEFKTDAISGLEKIPSLKDMGALAGHINTMAYYLTALHVLETTPEEMAFRGDIALYAGTLFKERVEELTSPETITTPAPANEIPSQPEPTGQSQDQTGYVPEQDPGLNIQPEPEPQPQPQPNPQPEPQPENSPQTYKQGSFQLELEPTKYENMPLVFPVSLDNFSGMSWSPESIVLSFQQLYQWISQGDFETSTDWVVFNVYKASEQPKVWLFSLVRLDTLQQRWDSLPITCQNYLGQMMEEPGNTQATSLWDFETCVSYFTEATFNEGSSVEIVLPNGEKDWAMHTGEDGTVDYVGGLWWGVGDNAPIKIGNVISAKSLTTVLKDVWDIFKKIIK